MKTFGKMMLSFVFLCLLAMSSSTVIAMEPTLRIEQLQEQVDALRCQLHQLQQEDDAAVSCQYSIIPPTILGLRQQIGDLLGQIHKLQDQVGKDS